MEPHNTTPNLKERILAQIEDKRVLMRPRSYFIFKVVVLGFVAFATLVVSIAIVNFISFSIRLNGHDSLLHFGPRGIGAFLLIFPWWLLILDGILLVLLEWLLRKFEFGYRNPVLYVLLLLLVITVSLGFAIDRGTRFNDDAYDHAEQHELPPPFGEIYEHARRPLPPENGICKCRIESIEGTKIVATDLDQDSGELITIFVRPGDRILPTLMPGDTIFVFGDRASTTISAEGIRKLPPPVK